MEAFVIREVKMSRTKRRPITSWQFDISVYKKGIYLPCFRILGTSSQIYM